MVDVCFGVKDGDVVTIITDDRRKEEADMVATVVSERGGWPIVANNETQVRRALQDTHFPMVPPRNLHKAMVTSDQIIIMTNLEWANRFAHVPAVKESVANQVRIGSIEEGFGLWPISVEDIERTIGNAKSAISLLEGKKRVRVTSPAGTDVEVSIERRPALEVVPVKLPGAMMGPAPLWGEVAYAAVEDQTNGTIVVDGNMLGIGVPGHVEYPITWPRSWPSLPSERAILRPSARPQRRAARERFISLSETTRTAIPAARTRASCTWTGSATK